MKLIQKKFALVIFFILVLAFGFIAGLKTTAYLYKKHCFSKILNDNAMMLAWQIDTVCKLHLGQVEETIDYLENAIDLNIVSMARSADMNEGDYKYLILSAAKTYRQVYRSHSSINDSVEDVLNDINDVYLVEGDSPLGRVVEYAKFQKKFNL